MQEFPGAERGKGRSEYGGHGINTSQGWGKTDEASDEDLKTVGPNFDFELWQPARKNHRKMPDDSQGD